jgi:hypothetical protein
MLWRCARVPRRAPGGAGRSAMGSTPVIQNSEPNFRKGVESGYSINPGCARTRHPSRQIKVTAMMLGDLVPALAKEI